MYQEPDGTYTAAISSQPVHYQDASGAWQDINSALLSDTTGWHGAANDFTVHFASDSTASDLLALDWKGTHIAAGLKNALSVTPTVSGSTITYPSILAGTDLSFTVTSRGISKAITLHSAPASSPTYSFHVDVSGLAPHPSGRSMTLDDSSGNKWTMPPVWMFDSTGAAGSDNLASSAVTLGFGQDSGGGYLLSVSPDFSWLSDPARVYPVTVDPTLVKTPSNGAVTYADTFTESSSGYANTPQDTNVELKTGTYDNGTTKARSFMKFDISSLASNAIISSATVAVNIHYASSLAGANINLNQITSSWAAGTLTWNSAQPSVTTGVNLDTIFDNPSSQSSSHTITFSDPVLTNLVTNWVQGDLPNYGVTIRAAETGVDSWRRMDSTDNGSLDPTLTVVYNTPPNTPTSLTPVTNTQNTDTTPVLSATYSDPDTGDTGYTAYEVYDSANALSASGHCQTVSSGSASVFPGASASCTQNNLTLPDGYFHWRARNYDGAAYSAWTAYNYLRIDTAAPTGALTVPANEATISGSSVTVTATPLDGTNGSGVSKVDFYATTVGGKRLVATDASSAGGWTATFDSRTLYEGRAILTAQYTDNVNNTSTTTAGAGASVIVDNALPAAQTYSAIVGAAGLSINGTDPRVILGTGQLVAAVEDDAIPGRGFTATFDRSYNSGSQAASILGPGWRSNLDDSLNASHDGSMLYLDTAGRELRYVPVTSGGLDTTFYNNTALTGTPVLSRVDSQVNFNWGTASPGPGVNADAWSARFKGLVSIPTTGAWTFYTNTDDGARLLVDGVSVVEDWRDHTVTENSGTITLGAGLHEVEMQYYDAGSIASATLSWAGPGVTKALIPASNLVRVSGFAPPAGTYDTLARNADASYTMTAKDQATSHFLANGRKDQITDINTNTLVIAYDGSGRPQYVCVSAASCTTGTAKLTVVYDASSRIQTLTDAYRDPIDNSTRSWTYAYDANGRLATVTDPLTYATTYAYDANGRLASITDAESDKGTVTYTSGRVSAIKDARSYALSATCSTTAPCATYSYGTNTATVVSPKANALTPTGAGDLYNLGPSGQLSSSVDPLGKSSSWSYDANFNVLTATDELNHTTTSTYDDAGNMLTNKDPLNRLTINTYYPANMLKTSTDPRGKVTKYDYDPQNNLSLVTDPLGKKTSYGYDGYGQKTSAVDPRGNETGANPATYTTIYGYTNGSMTSSTDPLGKITTYTYDLAGNRLSQTDPIVTGETQAHTSSTGYDKVGQQVSKTDGEGNKTTFGYDNAGRQTSKVDPRGNVSGGNPSAYTSTTSYYANGLSKDRTDSQTSKSTDAYDWNGNLTSETDPRNNVTVSEFDLDGRLTQTTAPDGGLTIHDYYDDGKERSVTDPKGTTSYFYDAAGRTKETDGPRVDTSNNPLKTTTVYDDTIPDVTATDPAGNVAGATPGSYATNTTYDDAGNAKSVTDAVGTTTYLYDAAGNRTQITDPRGATTKFTYDTLGREAEHRTLGSQSQSATNTVDANGTTTSNTSLTTTMPGTINASADWAKMSPQDIKNYSAILAGGASTTYNLPAPGEAVLEASLTWQKGQTINGSNFTSSLSGTSTNNHTVSVTSTHTVITGSVDWTPFAKSFPTQSGSVSPPITPASTPYAIIAAGPGTISTSMTWINSSNSALTGSTHMHIEIDDASGNFITASSSTASQPATLSYSVTSPTPTAYKIKVIGDDLGANYTLTGTTPTYADVNLQLLNPANAVVASDLSASARPAAVSYTPTGTCTPAAPCSYTFKVISVADPTPTYTLSTLYPVMKYPTLTFDLLNPSNAVIETHSGSDGSVALNLGALQVADPGGLYKVRITNNSSWSTTSFSAQTKSTVIRPVVKTGSLANSGTTSYNVPSDGAGAMEADVDWAQGNTLQSNTLTGSLSGGTTNSHAISVTSTHAPITGSVNWTTFSKTAAPYTHSVLPLDGWGTNYVDVPGPGTITATLTWQNSANPALTPQTHMHLKINDATNGDTPATSPSSATQPLTLSYDVPASRAPGQFFVGVYSDDLAADFTLTVSWPTYADVNLQLLNPSNTVVASDMSTSTRPAALSYTPTGTCTPAAPCTYTFKVISVADPTPSYTLSTTYPIQAYADVQAKIYNPSGTLIQTTWGRPGKVLFTTAIAGTYRVDVVNNSSNITVSTYTLTVRPPTAAYADLNLSLLNASNQVVAQAPDNTLRPEALTYANAPAGTYTLRVTAVKGYGTFTLSYNTPTEQVATTAYDEAGRVKTRIDPSGTTTLTYDKTNRLLSEALPDSTTRAYQYFENGALKQVTDPSGTQSFTYDTVGRPKTETQGGVTTTHNYDATGNETSAMRGATTLASMHYDQKNRIDTATGNVTLQYTDKLNRTDVTASSGEVDHTNFDQGGLPTDQTMKNVSGGSNRLALAYTYDPQGNLLTVNDTTGSATNLATYTYDGADQLKTEAVKIGASTQSFTYNYDTQGNRTSTQRPAGTTNAVYNTAGQLMSSTDPTGKLTTYLYDSRGNLTANVSPSGTTTYAWSAQNRLTSVTSAGGSPASFTYDAKGTRLTKSVGSSTTSASYEGGRLYTETTGSSVVTYTYDNSGAPLTIKLASGATYTFHYDGRGSVIQLTDASHAVAATYTYDAWGNVLAKSGTQTLLDANPFTYRGEFGVRWDRETGLYLMSARYYDPLIGRFLSEDPVAADPSKTTYAYAANNPVAMIDPTGLYSIPWEWLRHSDRYAHEIRFCIRRPHWDTCKYAYALKGRAYTQAQYWQDHENWPHGKRNAFRHAFWMGMIVMQTWDHLTAMEFGYAHEDDFPGTLADYKADIKNNFLGGLLGLILAYNGWNSENHGRYHLEGIIFRNWVKPGDTKGRVLDYGGGD